MSLLAVQDLSLSINGAPILTGVDLEIADSAECYRLLQEFIRANGAVWHEDIGE